MKYTIHLSFILVGSYDSTAKIYDSSQRLIHTIRGHTGPVTSARWITPKLTTHSGGAKTLVTGSHDGTAMIVEIPNSEGPTNEPSSTRLASLHLHSGPISSVIANQAGTHILTSGWDTILGVFSAEIPEEDEVPEDASVLPRKKRRKTAEKENRPKRKVHHQPVLSCQVLMACAGTDPCLEKPYRQGYPRYLRSVRH
jgi:ribosome biogenesis protein YTM1